MKESPNIQLIISGCLNKHSAAERRLYDLFYGYAMSICRRYSSGQEEAEEMLNDSFYTVFTYMDRYDNQYDFRPWLRRVCINCCLQYLRNKKNTLKFEEIDDNIEVERPIDHYMFETISIHQYLKFVQLLSPAYRTVFNLYVFENYKHHEIAQKLEISINTSKSNLHRAKSKLRKLIEDQHPHFTNNKRDTANG